MVRYKLGCNFDWELIDGVLRLNEIDKNTQITEFYGSDRQYSYLTARPSYRVPDIDKNHLETYISRCNSSGIDFNYCMNTMYPGSKKALLARESEIKAFVKYLEDIGVRRVTVANPILAELVREASNSMAMEVSSIVRIDEVTQIKIWKERYNIDKVCGNLSKNRSIRFLRNAATYCSNNGIILNLLVNEFCANGGGYGMNSYAASCIYKDSCTLCHAENETKEDALSFNNYPMKQCMASRKIPSTWLKARFIRPEDIDKYVGIGISDFKITGRTGTTEYLLQVAERYIRKSFDGNLLELWKPLESINSDKSESEVDLSCSIDNRKLDGFIDYWFGNIEQECSDEVCGETCDYCNEFYNDNLIN